MITIYLDNCCYHRPFDDLSQEKIENEAVAKLFIQSLIKYKSIELYYSFVSLSEIDDSPFEDVKTHILNFIRNYATAFISDNQTEALKLLTEGIMQTGIKIKDATHLACAIIAKCDFFITTDKRVLSYNTDKIKIVNPIKFVEIWKDTV